MDSVIDLVHADDDCFNRGDLDGSLDHYSFPLSVLTPCRHQTYESRDNARLALSRLREENAAGGIARIETEVVSAFTSVNQVSMISARKTRIDADGQPVSSYTSTYAAHLIDGAWKFVSLSLDDKAWREQGDCYHTSFQ